MSKLKISLPILWMALIFFLSSRPDLPSANSFFLEFLFKKSGHVFVYTVLTYLWLITPKVNFEKATLYSLIFAFTDEIHQLFVPGRTGRLQDIIFDFLGILIGLSLYYIYNKWKKPTSVLLAKIPRK